MFRLNRKGFTLVEIMIVVAIIALLAAIAIPNLLQARKSANETVAQSTLRSWATACETYATMFDGRYPAAEANIQGTSPKLFPYVLAATSKSGYTYSVPTIGAGGYEAQATAASSDVGRYDYRVTTGAIMERATQGTTTWAGY